MRLAGINPCCKSEGSRVPCEHGCQRHPTYNAAFARASAIVRSTSR